MKAFRLNPVATALLPLVLLAACSSTPLAPAPAPKPVPVVAPAAPAPSTPVAATPAPAPTTPVASTPITTVKPAVPDLQSLLAAGRSVYFDFDDSTLKAEFNALIESHGGYLTAHPQQSVRIEGNTDERGSAEYNLALGQRRAESVRKALLVYGVKPAQTEAVSWGREKPRATGHDESAWAQNRRADLQYPTAK